MSARQTTAGVTLRVHVPTRRVAERVAPVRLAGRTMEPRAAQVCVDLLLLKSILFIPRYAGLCR